MEERVVIKVKPGIHHLCGRISEQIASRAEAERMLKADGFSRSGEEWIRGKGVKVVYVTIHPVFPLAELFGEVEKPQ